MVFDPQYQQKIDALEREIAMLKDLLLTLVHSVEYRADKVFDAFVSQLMIHGDERIKLMLILDYICELLAGKMPKISPNHPIYAQTGSDKIVANPDLTETAAIEFLNSIVGSANGKELLKSFRQQYRDKQ